MATSAHAPCAAVVHAPEIVSKCRTQPIRRGVARRASGGNDSDDRCVGGKVIWHRATHGRRALPLSCMAAVAIRGRNGGADMAKVAGHADVRPGQRESRRAVIKNRAEPGSGRVARRAGRWIPGTDVIGHRTTKRRGALPLRDVAAVAIGR